MNSFTLHDRRITYQTAGQSGPNVVLVHCSNASHREWASLIELLQNRFRCYAPDLIGYGESDPWPIDEPFDPYADVQVLAKLVAIIGEPVMLVGHSYGGAVSLEFARQNPNQVKKMVLIEPVAFQLLAVTQSTQEWQQVVRLAESVQRAIAKNNPVRAARNFMRYWGGWVQWWLMPKKVRQNFIRTIGKVAKEFDIISKVRPELSDYEQLNIPVRLIAGSRTRQPAKKIVNILQQLLPNVESHVVHGAGHMCPFTHKAQVNSLINDFLQG